MRFLTASHFSCDCLAEIILSLGGGVISIIFLEKSIEIHHCLSFIYGKSCLVYAGEASETPDIVSYEPGTFSCRGFYQAGVIRGEQVRRRWKQTDGYFVDTLQPSNALPAPE